jgi:hypothetical protein
MLGDEDAAAADDECVQPFVEVLVTRIRGQAFDDGSLFVLGVIVNPISFSWASNWIHWFTQERAARERVRFGRLRFFRVQDREPESRRRDP